MLKVLLSQKMAVMTPTSLIFVLYHGSTLSSARIMDLLKYWKFASLGSVGLKKSSVSKSLPAHCVPSVSDLSSGLAISKRSGFLQALQHLCWVLNPPVSGCASIPELRCWWGLPFGWLWLLCPCYWDLHAMSFLHWACSGVFWREYRLSLHRVSSSSISRQGRDPGAVFSAVQPSKNSTLGSCRHQTNYCTLQLSLHFHYL